MQQILKILEVSTGTYEGNDWCKVKARSPEIANGKILNYKVDAKQVKDISKYLDQDVTVTFQIVRGQQDLASLKIISVE